MHSEKGQKNVERNRSVLAVPTQAINRSKHRILKLDSMPWKRKLQRNLVANTVLKFEELKNRRKENINRKSSLCIFSNPRGGSTWLGEILSEIPESVFCNEPIFRLKEFSKLNFTWHQPIPAGTYWPEASEVFRKLLNREILRLNVYHRNDLMSIPGATRHIFKFCHGNMLLEWFADHFDVLAVLLVRHPCAVVSSQLNHPGWRYLSKEKSHLYTIPEFRCNDVYYQYEDVLKTVKTSEENLAATWCLTQINTLKSEANDVKWITVAYENLYAHFDYEIERIFGRLGIQIPDSVYDRRRKLSVSTLRGDNEHVLSGTQLSRWKDDLTKKQQNNIIGIVKSFGLNHYGFDLEPDLEKMYVQT